MQSNICVRKIKKSGNYWNYIKLFIPIQQANTFARLHTFTQNWISSFNLFKSIRIFLKHQMQNILITADLMAHELMREVNVNFKPQIRDPASHQNVWLWLGTYLSIWLSIYLLCWLHYYLMSPTSTSARRRRLRTCTSAQCTVHVPRALAPALDARAGQ